MLPIKAIKEYQQLIKKHYKIDLNNEDATTEANKLINLVNVIEKNMNMENENDYEQSSSN